MHTYLMEAGHFFLRRYRFQVDAENREEALEKGREYIKSLHDCNIIGDTIVVVKKLKPSFGKERESI